MCKFSSILVTLRSLVQPLEGQGAIASSGISRDVSGPSRPIRSRMPRANGAFASTQLPAPERSPHDRMPARYRPSSDIGRNIHARSNSSPDARARSV
jgi:hypothetical protein